MAAETLRVGDILIHTSPARGKQRAETVRVTVRALHLSPSGTLFIETSSFGTCRHPKEGVSVIRRTELDNPFNQRS